MATVLAMVVVAAACGLALIATGNVGITATSTAAPTGRFSRERIIPENSDGDGRETGESYSVKRKSDKADLEMPVERDAG